MEPSPNVNPSPGGGGSSLRTAPIPHTRFPHSQFLITFNYSFRFCTYFPGAGCLLSMELIPRWVQKGAGRRERDAGRCCCRAGHEVWLFFKELTPQFAPFHIQTDRLHISYRKRYECRRRRNPSVFFVSKNVMCHLLIQKRNIENILKRAILNYFWLMLQYLFSCIRNSFVEKKCIFH